MEIECHNCHYKYDFKLYGEKCPNCYFENKPFRSESARRLMGYEDDSYRNIRYDNSRIERREDSMRSGDPFYGKSPLRRLRPYLMLLAISFAVLFLGKTLIQISQGSRFAQAPREITPPIASFASAAFQEAFESVDGVGLQIRYTGIVPDEKLGPAQQGKSLCVFIHAQGFLEDTAPESMPGKLFLRAGDGIFYPVFPQWDGADLRDYTPFDYGEIRKKGYSAGEFFFYLPLDTETFTLCWLNPQAGPEQQIPLNL